MGNEARRRAGIQGLEGVGVIAWVARPLPRAWTSVSTLGMVYPPTSLSALTASKRTSRRGDGLSPTSLSALTAPKRPLVHEGGFTVEGTGHAPVFRDLRGRRIEPCPGLPHIADKPVAALVACNRREGLAITPGTNRITWAGEPIEYGWVVEALMPRQAPEESSA